jgi:hypothetical protein
MKNLFRWPWRKPQPEQSSPSSASVPVSAAWWIQVATAELAQGDLLPNCKVPIYPPDFGTSAEPCELNIALARLIIITQSCDLEASKVGFVALCPVHSLQEFDQASPKFATNKNRWEEVRKGRLVGLHLLPSPASPANNKESFVVNLKQVISLPAGYLHMHANSLGPRWRLQSPYLEDFSQAFARIFMRVGLPSAIEPFGR